VEPGVNDALQSRPFFFPSHCAFLWARSVGKEVVQGSRCWCPSYLDLCPHRLYYFHCIVSRTPRDADSDLIARSPFEVSCLFFRPAFVYPPLSSNFLIMFVPSRFEQGPSP